MITYLPKPLDFFIKRIGQRIYRDPRKVCCQSCTQVEKEGLIVHSKEHAQYLAIVDSDLGAEGVFLKGMY